MSDKSENSPGTIACPRTFWGVLPSLFLCALMAFVAHLLIKPHATIAPRLWMPILVETNGTENVMGETRQLEFWTPSGKTKDYLHMVDGNVEPTEKWQAISNDDPVIQFGVMLHTNNSVLGYHRVEVWGHGTTSFKPGWWWTMTVLTNYSGRDLAQSYQNFWQSKRPVFVEVIDNRGND